MAGSTNIQGEEVKKLDVLSNDLFINMIRSSYTSCLLISEENEEPIHIEPEKQVFILLVYIEQRIYVFCYLN